MESFTHQFTPPYCEASSWLDPIGNANFGYFYDIKRSDSYKSVPSIGFNNLRGHVSFDLINNIDFSNGVTIYMVYHKCDLNSFDPEFRLLHGSTDPTFFQEYNEPTNFCLMESVPPVNEAFQVAYSDTIGNLSLLNFSPEFTFTEGMNIGLNILIMRYDPNTTTLSIDINGLPKKSIVHNFNQVNCKFWGISGGGNASNDDGQPAGGWSF